MSSEGSSYDRERLPNILAGDLLLPRLIVKQSALEDNIDRVAAYCREHGVSVAPHVKTTMAPGILRRQAAAGVWGFTVATVTQAQKVRRAGFKHILIANEVVEPNAIAWLAAELRNDEQFEVVVLVDSVESVSILDATLEPYQSPRPVRVLIELGEVDGRAGCRTDDEAHRVANAVKACRHLQLAGLEGFTARPESFARLRSLASKLAEEQYFDSVSEVLVSVGGSGTYEATIKAFDGWNVEPPVRILLRPGCYATNTPTSEESPTLEIWGAVLSRPQPHFAVVGFGRRDVPLPEPLPKPLAAFGRGQLRSIAGQAKVLRFYDQHAIVELSADTPLGVGELVGCSVESPFGPAFSIWRSVPIVDDRYNVIETLDVLY